MTASARRHPLRQVPAAGWMATAAMLGLLLWAPAAAAMSVTPVHVEMRSAGASSRSQVTVTNESREPLPVEAIMQRLALGENGERRMTPAGDEFLVFPPQALIPAGGSQVFRLQWVGEPLLAESQSFMMSLTQIPVRPRKGVNGVQLVMSFGVQINVAPPKGVGGLKVVGTGFEIDRRSGKRYPTIVVQNTSNVHALLPRSRVKLSSGSWSKVLDETFLDQRIGIGLVQPGRRRKFTLPVEVPAGARSVQAVLEQR